MPKKITDGEYRGVTALSGAERYSHLVRQVADFQAVWGLRSPDGWVSMGDDAGSRSFPIWPHERYAQVFVSGDWSVSLRQTQLCGDGVSGQTGRDEAQIFPLG
jgi:hypothetical protein